MMSEARRPEEKHVARRAADPRLIQPPALRNRESRLPYSKVPASKRIEFRPPDPSRNPYLAFAAMLMAGLEGIRSRTEPPAPIDQDLYELPPDQAELVRQVPDSLEEVLNALEADHQFLLEGDVFTPDVIDTWLGYKREQEIDQVRIRPHPWEFHVYYDI